MGNPIRYARPRAVRHVRRFVVARPRTAEQLSALLELQHCEAACDVEWLESVAEHANARLGLSIAFPDPRLVIRANRIRLERSDDMHRLALYVDGVIYWRPCGDARALAFALWHELAEALLDASTVRFRHVDVQLLTLMLMARASIVEPWVRTLGMRRAAARLCRAHRHAERWALRQRLALLLVADSTDS